MWVSGAAVWQHLGKVHIGATEDRRLLLQASANQRGAAIAGDILGRPHYVTASTGMAGGTAADVLLYPTELAVAFDRAARAESDETRIIATMLVGVKPIHTKALTRLTGIDTS